MYVQVHVITCSINWSQLQQHPDLMKGDPSHQPHMISGSSKMRIDSDGEFDPVVSEEVDSCVETDGGSEETPV